MTNNRKLAERLRAAVVAASQADALEVHLVIAVLKIADELDAAAGSGGLTITPGKLTVSAGHCQPAAPNNLSQAGYDSLVKDAMNWRALQAKLDETEALIVATAKRLSMRAAPPTEKAGK